MRHLNEKQIAAIEILASPNRGGMTYRQVAEHVGVSEVTIHNWRKRDDFNRELKKRIVSRTVDEIPAVLESIPKHIIDGGNAAMLRTFLQMHDMLSDKVEVESTSKGVDVDDIRAKLRSLERSEDEK